MKGEARMVVLDNTDERIMKMLQRDGRMSYVDMAGKLGVTEGTARRRCQRLIAERLVHVVGIVDPFKVGLDSLAIIGLNVEPGKTEKVAKEVSAFDEIKYVAVTTGGTDIVVHGYFPSNNDLSSFLVDRLAYIQGITQVNTSLVLGICKQRFDWGVTSRV